MLIPKSGQKKIINLKPENTDIFRICHLNFTGSDPTPESSKIICSHVWISGLYQFLKHAERREKRTRDPEAFTANARLDILQITWISWYSGCKRRLSTHCQRSDLRCKFLPTTPWKLTWICMLSLYWTIVYNNHISSVPAVLHEQLSLVCW